MTWPWATWGATTAIPGQRPASGDRIKRRDQLHLTVDLNAWYFWTCAATKISRVAVRDVRGAAPGAGHHGFPGEELSGAVVRCHDRPGARSGLIAVARARHRKVRNSGSDARCLVATRAIKMRARSRERRASGSPQLRIRSDDSASAGP